MSAVVSSWMLKIWSFFLSLFYVFAGAVMPPSTDDIIKPLNSYTVKLNVALWADPQLSTYLFDRMPYFESACQDLKNGKKIDALVIAGDIAENGLLCEYEMVSKNIKNDKVKNYLMATGNHDVRMRIYDSTVERFTGFSNDLNEYAGSNLSMDKLNYKYKINGYTFIVLGTDRTEFEEAWFSDEQLQWLDDSLKEANKSAKPVFVVCHQPLKDSHGLPDTWGSPVDKLGSVGAQSDELFEIMNKYKRVVFISGHLHTSFGEYTYEKIGNIHSVNLPSLTIENKDGDCDDRGIGFMMEVYSGKVVFRARNFADGKYLPEYDITIKY